MNRFLILSFVFLAGCSNPAFKSTAGSLLARTGLVTSSQVETALDAGSSIAKSQETLTPEQEYYLGRAVSAKILAKYAPVSNSGLNQYVNNVGAVVAGVSDLSQTFGGYHVVIVESNEINAMAAPGGFIFVTKGFLRLLPNEDALAAVVAHEVAHVVMQHGVKAISNASLMSALTAVGSEGLTYAAGRVSAPGVTQLTGLFSQSVDGVVDRLLTRGYDRSQEYEADEYARVLLGRSGYNPGALETVLSVLEKQGGAASHGWFDTHPAPDDRIDELKDADNPPTRKSPPGAVDVRNARFTSTVKRAL